MIEVEVGIDDDRYVFAAPTPAIDCNDSANGLLTRDAEHPGVFRRPLLADSRFDQNPFLARFDEHTIHVHSDAVFLIGRTDL